MIIITISGPMIFNIEFASDARIASRRIFNSNRQIGAYSDLREAKGRLKGSNGIGGGGEGVWEERPPMAVG